MDAEPLSDQIDRLAKFIMAEVPGEPSQSEGAVDTAIRVIGRMQADVQRFRGQADHAGELMVAARIERDRLAAELAAVEAPAWRDRVVTRTTVTFGWRDRLRVLFGARLKLVTRVETENVLGRTSRTSADLSFSPLLPKRTVCAVLESPVTLSLAADSPPSE